MKGVLDLEALCTEISENPGDNAQDAAEIFTAGLSTGKVMDLTSKPGKNKARIEYLLRLKRVWIINNNKEQTFREMIAACPSATHNTAPFHYSNSMYELIVKYGYHELRYYDPQKHSKYTIAQIVKAPRTRPMKKNYKDPTLGWFMCNE